MGSDDSESDTYDLVVIGSGSAGRMVAHAAAEAGRRCAVIDKREPGGTCALRGCDAKDALLEAVRAARHANAFRPGARPGDPPDLDWGAAMAAKRDLVAERPENVAQQLADAGIDLIRGLAAFAGPDRITIDGARELRARTVVVDCGARPRPLDLPGADLAITSEAFLELEVLPRRMVAIGGGYIGMELGCLAAATGVDVTVVTPGPRPLAGFAPDLVDQLVADWRDRGLRICSGCRATGVAGPGGEDAGTELRVLLEDGGELVTDLVLHAAGRVPATAELQAERAGVGLADDGAVVVDPATMRSPTNARVWALGDCAASRRPRLTPVAVREAELVIAGVLGRELPRVDDAAIPTAAFTTPPLARVGVLPEDAPEGAEVVERDLGDRGWVRSRGEAAAGLRLVVDREADRLLGAHVLGPHAEELINTFALALVADVPLARLGELLPAYPSFGALTLGAAS